MALDGGGNALSIGQWGRDSRELKISRVSERETGVDDSLVMATEIKNTKDDGFALSNLQIVPVPNILIPPTFAPLYITRQGRQRSGDRDNSPLNNSQ